MRTIEVQIRGSQARKDARNAGVQGEGNSTWMVISLDESWDGFAKTLTWLDAKGENPVKQILGADSLVDLLTDTRTYRVTIPAEPLAYAGVCLAVLDGYQDGRRARTVPMEFHVVPAPICADASEPVDPTPTQAEQLQEQIDTLLDDMQDIANEAKSYAVGGTGTRTGEDTDNAKYYAETAAASAADAASSASLSTGSAQDASEAAQAAQGSAANAAASASGAASSAEDAAQSAQQALGAVGKTSYIGENGNWYEWRDGKFVDTGVSATALIDQNSGEHIKIWFGTLAEYNDLIEIRSDTYYNILEGVP